MNEELKIIIKAVTDSAKKSIEGVKNELNGLNKSGKTTSGGLSASFKGIAKGAMIAVGAIVAIGAALVNLGKKTMEYNKEQAKLNAAFMSMGASAETASQAYIGLYRFLGDSSKAVEAASHLAKITTNQQHLAEWSKIAQGVYATFGDSLPIEGLTEAANETLRVGKVTGTLADALNWAGVSEDAFNAKLATTNSLEEREAMLRSTLNDLYKEAADLYERNNKAILDYNESQARLDAAMGNAGMAVTPLLTALNNLGTAFFNALKPALDVIIPILSNFINMIAKAVESVLSFFSALTGKSSKVKAFGNITNGAAKSLGGASQGANNLAGGLDKAGGSAKEAEKAIEDAKKSTQGFDELNIVSSGKSASSGSGGSSGGGGGSGSPGYAGGGGSAGVAEFGTEVEEADSATGGFAETLRNTFGKLMEDLQPSFDAWGDAIDDIKQSWNNAKPDFINGADGVKEAFKTLGSYLLDEFIPNVVNSFSTNLAPVFGDLAGFSLEEAGKAFSWFGDEFKKVTDDVLVPVGKRIETVYTDVFDAIGNAWDEHGSGLLDELSEAFENIRGHLENFYDNVFKPIWDKVLEVFDKVWDEGLKPLVENFVESALKIGEELLTLYNETISPIVDWIIENILPPIVDAIEKIVEILGNMAIDISKVINGVIETIEGIVTFIVGVFTGDWEKAWEGIKTAFDGVWEAIKNIAKLAWDAIKLIFEPAAEFFKGIWEKITEIFKDVKEWFEKKFKEAWEAIKGIWEKVSGWFKENVWNKITDTFGNVKEWFKTKFEDAWKAIKDVFSGWGEFFSGLWNKIKETFNNLGGQIGEAIGGAVKTAINGVISTIEKTINKAVDLINGAINLINKLPGVSVGKLNRLTLPRLAKGGIVDSATIAMIGEQGKEAVVPLENNTQWMDKLADRIASRNQNPTKVILKVGEKELGWATISAINGITEQTGGLQLAL